MNKKIECIPMYNVNIVGGKGTKTDRGAREGERKKTSKQNKMIRADAEFR